MKRVAGLALTSVLATQTENDRTITKVVKLLQQMLETSKKEDKADTKTFGEYKCYCDDNEFVKKSDIDSATKAIELAQSDIERLQGSSGVLSSECAKLEDEMAANVAARNIAKALRADEAKAFGDVETDLTTSSGLVKSAIEAFANVGADQTLKAAADHEKFMGKSPSLLSVKSEAIRNVLRTTLSLVSPQQAKVLKAFVQAPGAGFTGNYAAQSGEVVGILKNMKDTFARELSAAQALEQAAIKAFNEFIKGKKKEHDDMSSLFDDKQGTLSTNDDELATAKATLNTNEVLKKESTTFLTKLLQDCKQTKTEYRNRNAARAAEQAALAEAISILNSDAAFATFGTVTATSKAANSFLQFKRISKHQPQLLGRIESLLAKTSSVRVQKVASLVRSGNPFGTVLKAIDDMLALNVREGEVDTENKGWCEAENTRNSKNLQEATASNDTLTTDIQALHSDIENQLIPDIASTEDSIRLNIENQKKTTKMKVEETRNYDTDIKNLQTTRSLLAQATKVLKVYYDKVETEWSKDTGEKALNSDTQNKWGQFSRDQAANSKTQGNIFFQLDLISTEALEEEKQAHEDELQAQHTYEDAMKAFVDEQTQLRLTLANTQKTLAEKKLAKLEKEKEKQTEEERIVATKKYQAEIFPGCNFILTNFDTREANRKTEETALKECITLIQATDTYQLAVASAHEKSLGDCKDICAPNEKHANCKACLASVTVAGYCAGHTAEGCP